jgi:HK97 family phage prohead protease
MQRAAFPSKLRQVRDREIRAVISSGLPGRDGLVIPVENISLDEYKRNPVVLLGHDINRPIARCSPITRNGSGLEGLIQFPPAGVSPAADEAYGLVRSNVINGVSVGFEETIPSAPRDRNGNRVVRGCTLLEISLVTIPADSSALIFERGMGRGPRSTWYLTGARSRSDLGHRLLALQGLQPKAYRMAEVNSMRFPGAAAAFAGDPIQRARNERDREEARRAHQQAVTEASLARRPAVPMARAARLRELAELRGK